MVRGSLQVCGGSVSVHTGGSVNVGVRVMVCGVGIGVWCGCEGEGVV